MLIATSSDSLTAEPTTNWKYLAGTTSANTIKSSTGVTLQLPSNLHSRQQVVIHNGKLHVACEGKTSAANPTAWRAHVARLETNGTWTLLGGDQGLKQSGSFGNNNNRIAGLYSYAGTLYAAFNENTPLGTYQIARWDTGTNAWVLLSNNNFGLHYDSIWTTNPETSSLNAPVTFTVINGQMYVIFVEYKNSLSQYNLVASRFVNPGFVRVAELGATSGLSAQTTPEPTAEITVGGNTYLFFYHRFIPPSPGATYLYKFDGSSFTQTLSDTSFNGNLFYGLAPMRSNLSGSTELISIFQGTNTSPGEVEIRRSSNQGVSFTTTDAFFGPEIVNYPDMQRDAQILDDKLYATYKEDESFVTQPHQAYLLRCNFSEAPYHSWSKLGGGAFNTSMEKNVTQSHFYSLSDNNLYVLFSQESFFPDPGYVSPPDVRYPDNKVYIATATP